MIMADAGLHAISGQDDDALIRRSCELLRGRLAYFHTDDFYKSKSNLASMLFGRRKYKILLHTR